MLSLETILEVALISSKISTAPTWSHFFLSWINHSISVGWIPPSPCTGSTITAWVFSVNNDNVLSASSFLQETSGSRGSKGAWYFEFVIILRACYEFRITQYIYWSCDSRCRSEEEEIADESVFLEWIYEKEEHEHLYGKEWEEEE